MRETEAGSLLCPVSWSEDEERMRRRVVRETERKNTVSRLRDQINCVAF